MEKSFECLLSWISLEVLWAIMGLEQVSKIAIFRNFLRIAIIKIVIIVLKYPNL